MVAKEAFLAEWPWERLGHFKYLVYAPFVGRLLQTIIYGTGLEPDNWAMHMFFLMVARYFHQQLWVSASRVPWLTEKFVVDERQSGYEQVDREYHSDNHLMLQLIFISVAHSWFPGFSNVVAWNTQGFLYVLLFHVGVVEVLYYWIHRAFHTEVLFRNYHFYHHMSVVPEPPTGSITTMLEQILQSLLVCVPLLGAAALGGGSMAMIYIYLIAFDFFKCWGHSNFEFVPEWFRGFPGVKYLLYTPSYHSLHHLEQNSNFCLFMPLFDYLGGTVDPKTESLYAELRKGRLLKVPDFVFLAHCIDVLSSLQVSFCCRTMAAHPYKCHWFIWWTWPITVFFLMIFWYWGQTFTAMTIYVNKLKCTSWVIPKHGFQFFLPFGLDSINKHIEKAILEADKQGVKVISLAALNKNEALNGGGLLFVKKHPNLKVRVVHGNTLTAAVIIKTLPPDVKEVFMTGATSKLGRAIALYLCARGIRVLMLTTSTERFDAIQREAPADCRNNLIHVTKYQAGKNCKTWIVGKWTFAKDQQWAPPGTFFHQFVVPVISEVRKDCTYGQLAGMVLPKEGVKGLRTCEFTMERGAVHACHAGGMIHTLEGWTHHEVGSIDVSRIDVVWEAAMRHGFAPIGS
ncbi:very-long-chain aldehyde decarbonylase GL1-1 [Physcomitrium patens]|uniref:Uncharacterized protein n=1 Tax=Physcomitrium patens TaxID=3218 RepID=A9TT58_PHYPA|nr:protein ECERIFERUM 3-like [Physcomitrium patens]PNR50777.1 hypothetical protein PHYPA_009963 [Physcomitrium patens]|eukprot:XP_024379660.1 protein ECERIFERUM 3-like [Physcomitrella patens]